MTGKARLRPPGPFRKSRMKTSIYVPHEDSEGGGGTQHRRGGLERNGRSEKGAQSGEEGSGSREFIAGYGIGGGGRGLSEGAPGTAGGWGEGTPQVGGAWRGGWYKESSSEEMNAWRKDRAQEGLMRLRERTKSLSPHSAQLFPLSKQSPSHFCLHHHRHHISALTPSQPAPGHWGHRGGSVTPPARELLVTRKRLFITWAQRVWATRWLGVAGGGGAHFWPC